MVTTSENMSSKVGNGVDLFDAQTRYMAANNAYHGEMQSRHIPRRAQTELGSNSPRAHFLSVYFLSMPAFFQCIAKCWLAL